MPWQPASATIGKMGILSSPNLAPRALRDVADALAFFTRLPRLGAPPAADAPFAFSRFAWAARPSAADA